MTSAKPLVVGHRGAALLAPENTLSSFRRALADGADLLECDVHLSSDGTVMVIHDETIDRTASPDSPLRTGAIANLSSRELETVRQAHDEHIPTLAQLLDLTTVPLFIEVKVPTAARAVGQMLAALPAGSPEAASTVISFHAEALAEIRRASPETPVSYLARVIDEQVIATARELGAVAIGPAIDGLCLAAARAVREAGLRLHPWTVNTEQQLQVALACGADSITTDDPGWVKEQLAERQPRR